MPQPFAQAPAVFPPTRGSVVARLRGDEGREEAFEAVANVYWKPVYKYLRVQWNRPAALAQDLTQDFFALAFEKDFFRAYDPSIARFRTFLRVCVDRFVANADRAARRLKRGGGRAPLSLDFDGAEVELARAASGADDAERYFATETARQLLGLGVDELRRRYREKGNDVAFRLFELYDLGAGVEGAPPSYADLARRFDIAPTDVTNYLAAVRRDFRRVVLEQLRAMTASDEEYRDEARQLLGYDG